MDVAFKSDSSKLFYLLCLQFISIQECAYAPLTKDYGLSKECLAKPGDLILGYLSHVRKESINPQHRCLDEIYYYSTIPWLEAFTYAVDMVNSRLDILPNITLGYIMQDACLTYSPLGAVGRAPHFIGDLTNITDLTCENGVDYYKIAALIGPHTSSESIIVGAMMTFYQIPEIGTKATSDDLSNDVKFEYYMRVISPDRYQVKAIIDFLVYFNWTYVSLVFSHESYGENGAKHIEKEVKTRGGMCLAASIGLGTTYPDRDYDDALERLMQVKNARVIIMFTTSIVTNRLFAAMHDAGGFDDFLFIGADSMVSADHSLIMPGTFSIHVGGSIYPEFNNYYKYLTPYNASSEVWMKLEVERLFGCSYDKPEQDSESCIHFESSPLVNVDIPSFCYLAIDAVMVAANALDALIREKCASAFNDKSLLDSCVTGPDLLPYALNSSFQGLTGYIKFDSHGDMVGQYDIKKFESTKRSWSAFLSWNAEAGFEVHAAFKTIFSHFTTDEQIVPDSVCSYPCKPNEYSIPQDIPCCWECKKCLKNQVPDINGTGCVLCPLNYWPEETGTKCRAIDPKYASFGDPVILALLVVTTIGLISCLATSVMWVIHGEKKLIKASNKQISAIILAGISLALISVLLFLTKPTDPTCFARIIGFHFSVTLIYAPLLVKTNTVFRIFAAGKKGIKKPSGIGITTQMLIITFIILIQILIISMSMLKAAPSAALRMPLVTEKYSELICKQSQLGFLLPLSLNLFLLLACAVHGFLTRKLPENFNESWYIFVSVSTTVFIWVVFIPTYYSTFYAYYQVVLLSTCLILNSYITLLSLYMPKLYALYFVEEAMIKFQTNIATTTTNVSTNQVAPQIEEQ